MPTSSYRTRLRNNWEGHLHKGDLGIGDRQTRVELARGPSTREGCAPTLRWSGWRGWAPCRAQIGWLGSRSLSSCFLNSLHQALVPELLSYLPIWLWLPGYWGNSLRDWTV